MAKHAPLEFSEDDFKLQAHLDDVKPKHSRPVADLHLQDLTHGHHQPARNQQSPAKIQENQGPKKSVHRVALQEDKTFGEPRVKQHYLRPENKRYHANKDRYGKRDKYSKKNKYGKKSKGYEKF